MSDGYHPDNLALQPYNHDAVRELAAHALRLGVQFKINGIPFGASYNKHLWDDFNAREGLCGDGKGEQIRQVDGLSCRDQDGAPGSIVGGSASSTERGSEEANGSKNSV